MSSGTPYRSIQPVHTFCLSAADTQVPYCVRCGAGRGRRAARWTASAPILSIARSLVTLIRVANGRIAPLLKVRSGKGKQGGALDGIGKGGAMGAGGGGGSYDDYAGGGSSRRMDFQAGRG